MNVAEVAAVAGMVGGVSALGAVNVLVAVQSRRRSRRAADAAAAREAAIREQWRRLGWANVRSLSADEVRVVRRFWPNAPISDS